MFNNHYVGINPNVVKFIKFWERKSTKKMVELYEIMI